MPNDPEKEDLIPDIQALIHHLSHEARTSLTSIKWAATLLPEKIKENAEKDVQKLIDIIIEENERLIRLLDNLEDRAQVPQKSCTSAAKGNQI